MSDKEARELLRYAIRYQKSIRTGKLSRILQAMNISLKKNNRDMEIEYLRGEIRKLNKRIRKMRG